MEIFEEDKKRIIGVDENGYGPLLGPLVVTGVLMESDFDPFDLKVGRFRFPIKIKDSKKIFTRTKSSYFAGEIIAHAILEAAGIRVRSFHQLIKSVTDGEAEKILNLSPYHREIYSDFPLPIWAKEIRESLVGKSLDYLDINLLSIRSKVVLPYEFNLLLKRHKSKISLDFSLFLEIIDDLTFGDEIALLGKLGGTKFYTLLFERNGAEIEKILKETRGISSYRIHLSGKKIETHFIMDGDEVYLPITFASIIGKYIRELFMLSLNRYLGHDDFFPWASGYRHDHKTWVLVKELKSNLPREFMDQFIRRK
jgi:ribonuclease HII